MTAGAANTIGSVLCTACGLCCSGVVLSGVLVRDEEREWAARRRLPLVETPVGAAFAQPCPLLEAAACSAYEERPGPCRRFACKLLVATEKGESSLGAALAAVAALRADVAAIESCVEPSDRAQLWQLAALLADSSVDVEQRAHCLEELGPLVAPLQALRARVDEIIMSPEENEARRAD